MGNCMKVSRSRQQEEEIEKVAGAESGFEKENGKSSMKVKIVLTKEELELFLVKVKNNNNGGGKSLGELLEEMERARSVKQDSWRPSLESIMEDDSDQGL